MSIFSSWDGGAISTRLQAAPELAFEADWLRWVQPCREGAVDVLLQPEALLAEECPGSSHTCRGGMVEALCDCWYVAAAMRNQRGYRKRSGLLSCCFETLRLCVLMLKQRRLPESICFGLSQRRALHRTSRQLGRFNEVDPNLALRAKGSSCFSPTFSGRFAEHFVTCRLSSTYISV